MSKPFFSIVITCYNYEKYVGLCIKSVLEQDFKDFEVVAVNAGSTDNSNKIINSFRNIIKTSAPKGSHSIACSYGFKKSSGKWVLFLDADDFLFSYALSSIRKIILPSFSKIQFNLKVCNEKGEYGKRDVVAFPKSYNTDQICEEFEKTGTYIWPVTSGNVYSATFLKRVFPLKAFLPPDGQLNTMAPAFGSIGQINHALGCYRLHSQNIDYRSLEPWNVLRFQRNIKRRYQEIYFARKKVHYLKRRFPLKFLLNKEFAFISYRIFLKKLKVKYFLSSKDNLGFLLFYLLERIIYTKSVSFMSFSFITWYLVFLLSPAFLAKKLLKQRFSR